MLGFELSWESQCGGWCASGEDLFLSRQLDVTTANEPSSGCLAVN